MKKQQRGLLALARVLSRAPHGPLFNVDPGAGGGGGAPGGAPGGVPGGPPAPGAPGADPAKRTFTQEDFDAQIGKIRKEERAKFADYEDLKTKAAEAAELKLKNAELTESVEGIGKTASEKAALQAEKAAKQIREKEEELLKANKAIEERATKAEQKLRSERINAVVGAGLDAAKVYPSARAHAAKILSTEAEIDLDDETGKITSVTWGGVAHKNMSDAAAAFLKENPHFADAGTPGGAGSRVPSGGGGQGGPADQSAEGLIAYGMAQRSSARR